MALTELAFHLMGNAGAHDGDLDHMALGILDALADGFGNLHGLAQAHAHHAVDLDETRQVLADRHPEFLPPFDAAMRSTKGHRFNMMVMKRPVLDAYCTWLFDVLFELERRLDISAYSPYDARVFGFVAERLLDVWLGESAKRMGLRIVELPVIHLESQHWPKKAFAFLKRKFFAKA